MLAVLLRRFDFELVEPGTFPGMTAAATIHTAHGLNCYVRPRTMPGEE